ncbi:MAG TPA: twin-arginine translocation signal domain-containing protein, partial [Pseudoxanthomonas sp.]|nr:twin-arginine translocation signal domain-containing protein [Pseudoxanthomonas sp.]
MRHRRRNFLKGSGLAALFAAIPRSWAGVVGYPRALQGPMIGSPGPNHFTVWVRASGAFEVSLEYSTTRDFRQVLKGSSALAKSDEDCCV